jgi:hypothetical protein
MIEIVIVALLALNTLSTLVIATLSVLLYARLQGVNLPRLRFEVSQLWKKREKLTQGRPIGV